MKSFLKSFIIGLFITAFLGLATYIGIIYPLIFIPVILTIFLFLLAKQNGLIFNYKEQRSLEPTGGGYEENSKRRPFPNNEENDPNNFNWRNLTIMVFAILTLIPAIFFTWIFNPEKPKLATKITVLFISFVGALFYYLINKDKFPGPSNVVGFFAGTTVSPFTITSVLVETDS